MLVVLVSRTWDKHVVPVAKRRSCSQVFIALSSEMVLQLIPSRPHLEEGTGTPWAAFARVRICSQPVLFAAHCCELGWGRKASPGVSVGWHSPARLLGLCKRALVPTCRLRARWLGESCWIHPHQRDGGCCSPLATHPWAPHGWGSRGAQHPWATLSHSPQAPVTIEGPMLPSAGLAAQEQQELRSALLEVAHPKHAWPRHSCAGLRAR